MATQEVLFVGCTRSSNRFFIVAMNVFSYFGFVGYFGAYFHKMTSPIVVTLKRPSRGGNTSFEPFSVRIGATVVRPGSRIDKKVTRLFMKLFIIANKDIIDECRRNSRSYCYTL